MAAFDPSVGEEIEEASLCSFALGQEILLNQPVYACFTCDPGEDGQPLCCCKGCAQRCHAGHQVQFLAQGKAYCDCFQRPNCCQIMQESIERCSMLLQAGGMCNGSLDKEVNADSPVEWLDMHTAPVLASEQGAEVAENLVGMCKALVQESKETFWISPSAAPRCPLEALALDIFHYHMGRLGLQPRAQSGAEWWVQVKELTTADQSQPRGEGGGGEEAHSSTAGVDLHYDKDEVIAEAFEIGLYPEISTVTYLTEAHGSAPTAVFKKTAEEVVDAPIRAVGVVHPRLSKHLSFNGKLLHGAPGMLMSTAPYGPAESGVEKRYRVTFLVNVWVRHKPVGVHALPDAIVAQINGAPASLPLSNLMDIALHLRPDDSSLAELQVDGSMLPTGTATEVEIGSCALISYIIPFLSDAVDWEKGTEEVGLSLALWLPRTCKDVQSNDSVTSFIIRYSDEESAAFLVEDEEEEEEEEEEEGEMEEGEEEEEEEEGVAEDA